MNRGSTVQPLHFWQMNVYYSYGWTRELPHTFDLLLFYLVLGQHY